MQMRKEEEEKSKQSANILAVVMGRQTDKICCHIDKFPFQCRKFYFILFF